MARNGVIYKNIRFRSILECSFAIYLDNQTNIKSWSHKKVWMWYIDGFTGKDRKYICDFRVVYNDESIEHIEVKSLKLQTFVDKYLYAKNMILGWRFISKNEIEESLNLFSQPNLPIEFPEKFYKNLKKFSMLSKKKKLSLPKGYKLLSKQQKYKQYYEHNIINNNLV